MPTLYELKKNLERNLRESYLNSGGMRVRAVAVSTDNVGVLKIEVTIDNQGLPQDAVEQLVDKSFNSIGIKAFVDGEWSDMKVSHEGTITKIFAQGFLSGPKEPKESKVAKKKEEAKDDLVEDGEV